MKFLNPNLSVDRLFGWKWKGYLLSHYTQDRWFPALGWVPDKGFKWRNQEHADSMRKELNDAFAAIRNEQFENPDYEKIMERYK